MTGILDRLGRLDLIERQPHLYDRRTILICLTDQERKYAKKINTITISANKEFMRKFSHEENEAFRNMLKRVQT